MAHELIEEFADWLHELAMPDAAGFADYAEMFLDWRAGAPVASLDEDAVRAFLLDWCPRHLSLPADQSSRVCEAVGEFVYFLGRAGRLRGGAERARRLQQTAVGLATAMRTKMADPSNYGMSKSLFAGIEGAESMSLEELQAAVQQRIDEHNALPLEQRRAATDPFFDTPPPMPQPIELPFFYVPPPEADVAAAVAGAALPAKVQALRDYLGERGKALTAKGNLKLADGRALVDILDTGDEIDPKIGDTTYKTHSTATLRQLMYLIAVAKESGAVRCVDNRLVPVKAWSRKSPTEKAVALFHTVIEFGVLSMTSRRVSRYTDVCDVLDDVVVHWLAGLLAPGARAPFDDVTELNERIVLDQLGSDEADYYVSAGMIAEELSRIVEMLDMAGAIEWTGREESLTRWGRRVWRGGTIVMTAFGRHTLPAYLPGAGIVLRTAPDITDVGLAELIEVMAGQPQEQHSATLAAWKPTLSTSERVGLVATMVAEADDAGTRLDGLHLLKLFEAEAVEPYMRQLLDTAAAGHAAMWLLEHDLADAESVGGFVTPAVMVDILSQMIDDPDSVCEQFLRNRDPREILEFLWRHPAPETAAVLDVLGRHLPDRALAKQARKAAIRHRSWLANGGFA
ncbi:hypothetical protein BayCH28_25885 [Mycolicibacterium sp. CH28]|uniref:hypothetical protein n=1 Tax=Mycolicibacterium sp. CH28 TaxID=2512237 RepID=UPI00108195A1|nr:hypothetical protein [Mycolicibacterium sp. CH28]TGD84341.1 hypothetical protein BayCH28_25885 [Mycolicibacterium sp. CH28]